MDFRRLFDILYYQQAKYPQKVALAHRWDNGPESFSTEEAIAYIDRVSAGLLELGLSKGDKIGIMTHKGFAFWNFVDLGAQRIGIIPVPMHGVTPTTELSFILKDADIKVCFVEDKKQYDQLEGLQDQVKSLKKIFTFNKYDDLPCWKSMLKEPLDEHEAKFQTFKAAIHEDDLATIIYTSGAMGTPKGVMLSHKNIVSNIKAIIALVPVNCDKQVLSFLPLSHIFERMVVYTYLAVGASVHYLEGVDHFEKSLKEIRPHYFTCVPRVLEKVLESIKHQGSKLPRWRRAILNWGIRLGRRFKEGQSIGLLYFFKLQIADWLVFRWWRNAMGGRIEGVVVGAAALRPELGKLFSAAGIDIREGYGLTETAPVIAFNRFEPGGVRFGTVGIPIPGVDVRIDAPQGEEGEILVKGPNVMLGYYNRPDLTKQVFTEDGWLRTGDIGRFVHKRFLQITGRKKVLFKTSSGKFVSPQLIEQQLLQSPFIENCMVIGLNRPFVAALIVPDFKKLKAWTEQHQIHWTAPPYMVVNNKVNQFMEGVVDHTNKNLQSHEKVRKVHLIADDWSVTSGHLTATLKLRRPVVYEKYQKYIEEMYDGEV